MFVEHTFTREPFQTFLGYQRYLVDLQDAVDLAALVLLLLHLLGESLPLALLDGVGVLKGPASPPVRLPHVIAGVAAPVSRSRMERYRSLIKVGKNAKISVYSQKLSFLNDVSFSKSMFSVILVVIFVTIKF